MDVTESRDWTDFSEKLLVLRISSRVVGGGGVSLRYALRLAAFMLCTRRRFVPCGRSSLALTVGDNLFCFTEVCRLVSEALRDGVEGTDGVAISFLVLEVEDTVLRAKLGTSELFLGPSVCELLFSEEATHWAWA